MSLQDSRQLENVKVLLKVGADGRGIADVELVGTSGDVNTYDIVLSDGTRYPFNVTNGSSIASIEKTATVGLTDTYTITLTNGDEYYFEVTNADGATAGTINYDNTESGLTADKVQGAIDELASGKVSKSGDTMTGTLSLNAISETQARFVRQHTGTNSAPSRVVLGNDIAEGTEGSAYGRLMIYGKGSNYAYLQAFNMTSNRTIELPNKNGTLAVTDDIPTDFVSKSSGGTFSGNVRIDRANGTTSSTGSSDLIVGNDTPSGTAGNSRGYVTIYGTSGYYGRLKTNELTAYRNYDLPDKNGTVAMTSDISSEKFKENIKPLSAEEANKLLDVEVVTFDYKDGVCGEDERYSNRGVIAEQVEPIIPYVVEHSTEEDEEVLRVDYRKFIPYLIKMVQNQQAEIEELKKKIKK